MKIYIGSNSSSLLQTLNTHYSGHGFSVRTSAHDMQIDLFRELPEAFCTDLSAILTEHILPRLLIKAMADENVTAEIAEQESLTDIVISELLKSHKITTFRNHLRTKICDLLDEGNRINIEGLICFRMKDQLDALYRAAAQIIRKYMDNLEKNRLLKMLRQYIEDHPARTEYLRVCGTISDYHIYDAKDREIHCIFPNQYTPEEYLLNTLLYLSPAVLDLSELKYPELYDLLTEIFSGRVLKK